MFYSIRAEERAMDSRAYATGAGVFEVDLEGQVGGIA